MTLGEYLQKADHDVDLDVTVEEEGRTFRFWRYAHFSSRLLTRYAKYLNYEVVSEEKHRDIKFENNLDSVKICKKV